MASIARKLNRKYKGIKWINTRFALPYKRAKAIKHMQQGMAIASGICANNSIMYTSGVAALKAMAIAENTIKTAQAVAEIAKDINKIPGPYRG